MSFWLLFSGAVLGLLVVYGGLRGYTHQWCGGDGGGPPGPADCYYTSPHRGLDLLMAAGGLALALLFFVLAQRVITRRPATENI